ncbi:MAG: hypothetical protein JRF65_04470 [Deltaproteobacteria bacterium]|nr:hypothetical protein [Deltaproteobacteria bacterium]
MRCLFLPLITRGAAIGTISRCLAIGQHLRDLGHEVFFLTNGEGARHVSESGFPFMEGIIPDPPGPYHPLYDLSDVAVFLNLTREDYLRHSLQAEHDAVERFRPDVLFSEFKLTAAITAARHGLPLVSTACSPADPRFVSPLCPQQRSLSHGEAIVGFNRILDERGLEPIEDVAELFFSRSKVKVAPTIPDIEPLLADVPGLRYVGYLLYDRWELAPLPPAILKNAEGKKVVFAYFSAGEIGPDRYTRVLPAAFDGTEFHVVVAVGHHPDLPRLPDATANTLWVRFVPGRSILEAGRAVLFHGGQNTAMASLIHEAPGLIVPGSDFERDFNARGIAGIGAGIHMATEDFNPPNVLQATRELIGSSYRSAAERFGRKILKQGGAKRAAGLVVDAAR